MKQQSSPTALTGPGRRVNSDMHMTYPPEGQIVRGHCTYHVKQGQPTLITGQTERSVGTGKHRPACSTGRKGSPIDRHSAEQAQKKNKAEIRL